MGAKYFLAREALESADQPRSEPLRTPQRTALSPTIPPMPLAIADEVIEKATSGTFETCRPALTMCRCLPRFKAERVDLPVIMSVACGTTLPMTHDLVAMFGIGTGIGEGEAGGAVTTIALITSSRICTAPPVARSISSVVNSQLLVFRSQCLLGGLIITFPIIVGLWTLRDRESERVLSVLLSPPSRKQRRRPERRDCRCCVIRPIFRPVRQGSTHRGLIW